MILNRFTALTFQPRSNQPPTRAIFSESQYATLFATFSQLGDELNPFQSPRRSLNFCVTNMDARTANPATARKSYAKVIGSNFFSLIAGSARHAANSAILYS